MEKNYQTKHIFLIIAILTAIFGPISYFFIPQTVADIVHHKDGVWFVSVPKENFTTFAVGFLFIFIASMTLFLLDIKKISIIISILFLGCAFAAFYLASQSFGSLSTENITYSPLSTTEKYTYTWEQVDKIIHHRTESGDISNYEFVFNDGKSFTIKDSPYFKSKSLKFNKQLMESNIEVEFSLVE